MGILSAFHCWEWCYLWVCHIWPLLCWGRFPLCPLSGGFSIRNGYWILSKAFSASTDVIIWFLFFNLLMWYIILIDLWVLKNPCIPVIMVHDPLNVLEIWFDSILLSIEHMHLCSSEILAYNFLFLWYLCRVLVSGWWWPHRMSLGVSLPNQFFEIVSEGEVLALL